MSSAKSHSLGPGLSTAEQVAGFCYLPFFVMLLSLCIHWVAGLLGLTLSHLQSNIAYFVINFVMIWVIFHGFLTRSFRAIRFWELVQALILGLCLYYAMLSLFEAIVTLLDLHIQSFNDDAVVSLVHQSKWFMTLCSVVLAPVVEETLVRGLLFGSIRPKSRITAYLVTIIFFSVIHVWQYFIDQDFTAVVLCALQYIPAGIALGWTYEKSGTIWGPIFLHMIINAISMGLI